MDPHNLFYFFSFKIPHMIKAILVITKIIAKLQTKITFETIPEIKNHVPTVTKVTFKKTL